MNLSNNTVEEIEKLIIFHASAIYNNIDVKTSNKAFDSYIKKICQILQNKRFDLFKQLLHSKNILVMSELQLFLLPFNEVKVKFNLLKIQLYPFNNMYLDKTGVQYLLKEYNKGRLKYPKLKDKKVVYVSKEEFLADFTEEEIKYVRNKL